MGAPRHRNVRQWKLDGGRRELYLWHGSRWAWHREHHARVDVRRRAATLYSPLWAPMAHSLGPESKRIIQDWVHGQGGGNRRVSQTATSKMAFSDLALPILELFFLGIRRPHRNVHAIRSEHRCCLLNQVLRPLVSSLAGGPGQLEQETIWSSLAELGMRRRAFALQSHASAHADRCGDMVNVRRSARLLSNKTSSWGLPPLSPVVPARDCQSRTDWTLASPVSSNNPGTISKSPRHARCLTWHEAHTQPLLDDVPDRIRLGPLSKTSAKGRALRKSATVEQSEHVSCVDAVKFVCFGHCAAVSGRSSVQVQKRVLHDRLHERTPR